MSEQSFNQQLEDEISLKDIIDFLSESWKAIALSGIVGGLLAAGYAFITPPIYEATASIQVAKVAGSDLETPSVLIEKLRMPMYYSTASYSACNVIDTIEPGVVIAKSIKPTLSKIAPIINFSFKANSPDVAKKCLESVVNDIRREQNLVAKPILENKKRQLTHLKKQLDYTQIHLRSLRSANPNFDFSDSKFSAASLLIVTISIKEKEVSDLITKISELEFSLAEPQTKETFFVAPINAPNQKVLPKRALILVSGVIAGLFLGLLFIVGRRSWLTRKISNQ